MKALSAITVMTVAAAFGGSMLPDGVLRRRSVDPPPHLTAQADSSSVSPDTAQPSSFPARSVTSLSQRGLGQPAVEKTEPSCSRLLGLVVPETRAALQASVSGVLRELPVEQGSLVNTGDLVAGTDDTEIVAACRRQQSQIALARDLAKEAELMLCHAQYTYDKTRKVYEKQATSETQFMEAKFALQSAQVKVEAAATQVTAEEQQLIVLQRQAEKHRFLAPFSGAVTEILRHPRQYVGEGDTVLWLESRRRQVKVYVPPGLLGNLKALRFSLASEADGLPLSISAMRPSLNPDGSRTVLLELPSTSDLLAGQIVRVCAAVPGRTR